jgi:hypothetical protein
LNSFKIEHIHIVSFLNKTLGLLKQSLLSTKKLPEVMYQKENFKKTKGTMKRRIFSLMSPVVATVKVTVE